MHCITVLRQQSARGGIIQPQRPNYLCWLPINPLSCFGSAVRPGATCDAPTTLRYAAARRFLREWNPLRTRGTSALPFTFKASLHPFLCPLSQIPTRPLWLPSSRAAAGFARWSRRGLPYVKLHWWYWRMAERSIIVYVISHWTCGGAWEKRLGARMGYEIHGDAGWRRYVCFTCCQRANESGAGEWLFEYCRCLFKLMLWLSSRTHPPSPLLCFPIFITATFIFFSQTGFVIN